MAADAGLNRDESLARFSRETFDLAIVGGGINGAAIAREAALYGLSVALVERDDFAGATSSCSSKLIHGGLRYLPQLQLRLVYTALAERERLHRITAPHLVRPFRFVFPLYRGRGPGRFALTAGLWLYDLMARTPVDERRRKLDSDEVRALEPALAADGLRGGASYVDGWADDARLTIENVLDAAHNGAAIANYLEVTGFEKSAGRVAAAALHDGVSGANLELRARVFINAAGPWLDAIRRLDDPAAESAIRLTKGVHLVFARDRLAVREPLVLAGADGRIVFVMPHGRYVVVGTTDTDFEGDPAWLAADRVDAQYLCGMLSEFINDAPAARYAVSAYAGLRALADGRRKGRAPSSVTREEVILTSRTGLISVAGGKLTTHRAIGEKVVRLAMRARGRSFGRSPTLAAPLPGARPIGNRPVGDDALASLPPEAAEIIVTRYGTRASLIAAITAGRPDLACPLASGAPAIGAEAVFAARYEMARTLSDFVIRRASLSWRAPLEAPEAGRAAAKIMAAELGWNRERMDRELAAFDALLAHRRVVS